MEEEAFEEDWADFMAAQGLALEDEVEESIKDSLGLLDIQDGTHAQWVGEDLAVLFVFDPNELESVLNAWDEARDGNIVALGAMLHWLQGLSDFLQACVNSHDEGLT
ncbi:MAG: hypothetical protein CML60_07160 [Rhodobacteraceae bacterium]|mgnify:FL=1|nr:hypothetical protein [Paracoccaceae bacterium]